METTNIENAQSIEEVTKEITDSIPVTIESQRHMNRAQRRAATKRIGKQGRSQVDAITETATKLDYIDLIQKLRELNKKKEKENEENEDAIKDN